MSHFSLIYIHIIIIYHENVTFFHEKARVGRLKVDNQTFGDTLQKLSQLLIEKSQSGSNRIPNQGWSTICQAVI